jgi:hypothetical protein
MWAERRRHLCEAGISGMSLRDRDGSWPWRSGEMIRVPRPLPLKIDPGLTLRREGGKSKEFNSYVT